MSDSRFPKTETRSEKQAVAYVTKAIQKSFLINYTYGGRELRGHNGKVYVCKHEKGNIIVITVLKANKFAG